MDLTPDGFQARHMVFFTWSRACGKRAPFPSLKKKELPGLSQNIFENPERHDVHPPSVTVECGGAELVVMGQTRDRYGRGPSSLSCPEVNPFNYRS